MQRLWVVFTLLLGLSVGLPAHAQSGAFEAWLYESTSGEMVRVNQSGEVSRLTLPLPAGFDTYPYSSVAVSPDGETFAYMAGLTASFNTTLVIYSARTNSVVATYAPTGSAYTSFDFGAKYAFSPSGGQLVFGYSLDRELGGWDMVLINLSDFSLVASVSSVTPAAAGVPNDFGITPTPLHIRSDGLIAFAAVRAGTDGMGGFDAFLWDPVAGSVTPTVGYSDIGLDIFAPTGEVISAGTDARFPATPVEEMPFGQLNVLSYFTRTTGLLTPFHSDAILSFYGPTFVMNGAYILVGAFDGLTTTYRLLDRSGTNLGGLDILPAPYNTAGTRDGFIYLQQIGTTPALFNVNLRDGTIDLSETETAVWIGTDGTSPTVVWVGGGDPTVPYFSVEPSYTTWGALAAGVGSGGAGETTTPAALTVGGQATIRTTEGDSLNIRSGAGTAFAIVRKAAPGMVVTLLEGPTSGDGYVWWRLRLPDGTEGWAVESADNEITLLPGAGAVTDSTSPDPSISSELGIGDSAYVRLTARIDALRLRNEASTTGGVIVLMPNGTPVTVVGGPVSADDFTWWQLRTSDGTVGWAAEVIGSERVLVKGTSPAVVATSPAPPVIAPVTTPEL